VTGTMEPALAFREAMARFPSGVTIVTTTGPDGQWWGFTATAFCSVSADPPLVLVCLAKSAECYPVFAAAVSWAIHVLPPEHAELALRFATRGADKFGAAGFTASARGLPVLEDACVVLECDGFDRYDGGDHEILVGRVQEVRLGDGAPAVYFQRNFHTLPR
jgi:flavin reductase ActVB